LSYEYKHKSEKMTPERIKEIQEQTAYPESHSVQQALLQVWNECEQEKKAEMEKLKDFDTWKEWKSK
jgi:hypothetical protein